MEAGAGRANAMAGRRPLGQIAAIALVIGTAMMAPACSGTSDAGDAPNVASTTDATSAAGPIPVATTPAGPTPSGPATTTAVEATAVPAPVVGRTAEAVPAPVVAGTAETVPAPVVEGTADWSDPTQIVELGGGATLAACEGGGPFLCVDRGGVAVGVVEGIRFPVDSFDTIDPSADLSTNLRAVADDFVESLESDRERACPAGYSVEPVEPTRFVLGGLEALSYGYVGTNGDGSPSELNLQYAAIDDGDLVLVTAIAYDEGGCPGRDGLIAFDSETLAKMRPALEEALHDLPLPPPLG